ncbi:Ribosome-binding protein 1, putative [Babesia ovata]|uniref:Ribosome-binding protein 1, putative n=1 Tax=Babesia ovata TaxID=189622 RepID=A0A2H6KA55_9APIC|nr:Ribosome-binding protein 1, putative [Babesia ovata]GBE59882.1 Ribosome-binding protein 1, putative [Babesia ovata]
MCRPMWLKSCIIVLIGILTLPNSLPNVKAALSKFLENASGFYTRLCYNPQPWEYRAESADKIAYALLECMPKFLSVMYFLWYNVDPGFEKLDGGGWKQNWPGALKGASWWWNRNSGGDLDKYLYAETGDATYNSRTGVIPGGFTSDDEVIYYTLGSGYYQGAQMAGDLKKIVDKGNHHDFFRDVFVTSVLSTDHGAKAPNTANALRLVRMLCQIVEDEAKKNSDGEELIKALEHGLKRFQSSNSICWQDLKAHCAQLTKQFRTKLFAPKHFDHTGQGMDTSTLNRDEFASITADWLRTNITKVQGHLNQIKTDKSLEGHLGEYFTKNLFPYGFTIFNGTRFDMFPNDVEALKKDWREVIEEFKKSNGDLNTLREILSGTYNKLCPNVTPPIKPEAPPAKVPEGQQKSEGAQNQGKKAADPPSQNTSQSADTSSGTSVGQPSVAPLLPGKDGAAGPKGPNGPVTPEPSGSADASSNQGVQRQQVVTQTAPDPPPAISPPSAAGGDGPPDKSGSPGSDSHGNVPPAPQPGTSQDPARTQTLSASGSGSGPTGAQGTGEPSGGGGGKGGDHAGGKISGQDVSSNTTAPGTTMPGGGGTDQDDRKNKPCADGYTLMSLGIPSGKFCVRTADLKKHDEINKKWYDKVKNAQEAADTRKKQEEEEKQQREAEVRRRQEEVEEYKRKLLQGMGIETKILNHEPERRTYPGADIVKAKTMLRSGYKPVALKMPDFTPSFPDGNGIVGGRGLQDSTFPPVSSHIGVPMGYPLKHKAPQWHDPPPPSKPVAQMYHALPEGVVLSHNEQRPKRVLTSRATVHSPMQAQEVEIDPALIVLNVTGKTLDGHPKDGAEIFPTPLTLDATPVPDDRQERFSTHIYNPPIPKHDVPPPTKLIANKRPPPIPAVPKNAFHTPTPFHSEMNKPPHSITLFPGDPPSVTQDDMSCMAPWMLQQPGPSKNGHNDLSPYPPDASPTILQHSTVTPRTVREMLYWIAGLRHSAVYDGLEKYVDDVVKEYANDATTPIGDIHTPHLAAHPNSILSKDVTQALRLSCQYSIIVLIGIQSLNDPNTSHISESRTIIPQFEYSPDPACLLCHLRDYVYACCHQLEFLKSQCSRVSKQGGWEDCNFGRNVSSPNSPLQAFLTDAHDSKFHTHFFDPYNICRKSRVSMGFREKDLPASQQTGKHISTILTPTCGGEDPLLTLSSYLNCLTRRTPRTTGELVSFFHNFGNSLHDAPSDLSKLGSALSKPHRHCPDWDCLKAAAVIAFLAASLIWPTAFVLNVSTAFGSWETASASGCLTLEVNVPAISSVTISLTASNLLSTAWAGLSGWTGRPLGVSVATVS